MPYIESKRHQASCELTEQVSSDVSYWVSQAKKISEDLEKTEKAKPWNFKDYLPPMQRYLKRNTLVRELRQAAERADQASHTQDLIESSDQLSIVTVRKRPILQRPYVLNELVGYVGGTFVSIHAHENGKVVRHVVAENGQSGNCLEKKRVQEIFDAYYPVVLRRDRLAARMHRES